MDTPKNDDSAGIPSGGRDGRGRRRRRRIEGARASLVTGLCLIAACSTTPAAPASGESPSSGTTAASPGLGRLESKGPAGSSVEVGALTDGLPRSTEFANIEFSLAGARSIRQTPASYAAGGQPEPSDRTYAFLDLVARNTSTRVDIRLPKDVFQLLVDASTALEVVGGGFGSLDADTAADGFLAFELPEGFDLAAAVLQIGRRPDTPALLPLSGTVPTSSYPIWVDLRGSVVGPGQVWGEPVTFDLNSVVFSKDLAVERCCPPTGPRADQDEVFVTFNLQATGPDNRYGDSVGGRSVRILVDGVSRAPWDVPTLSSHGETVDFAASFVVSGAVRELVLELGDSSAGDPGRIPIPLPTLPSS
jgi:hypothetical protein